MIFILGESSSASTYRNVANDIVESAKGHYNGQYIYECNGREKDGAVIHAIITFGQYLYPPTSQEAASTVQAWNNAFCNEYPINQQDNGAGKPGILIGRYPGKFPVPCNKTIGKEDIIETRFTSLAS